MRGRAISPEERQRILLLSQQGFNLLQIEKEVDLSRSSIVKVISDYNAGAVDIDGRKLGTRTKVEGERVKTIEQPITRANMNPKYREK